MAALTTMEKKEESAGGRCRDGVHPHPQLPRWFGDLFLDPIGAKDLPAAPDCAAASPGCGSTMCPENAVLIFGINIRLSPEPIQKGVYLEVACVIPSEFRVHPSWERNDCLQDPFWTADLLLGLQGADSRFPPRSVGFQCETNVTDKQHRGTASSKRAPRSATGDADLPTLHVLERCPLPGPPTRCGRPLSLGAGASVFSRPGSTISFAALLDPHGKLFLRRSQGRLLSSPRRSGLLASSGLRPCLAAFTNLSPAAAAPSRMGARQRLISSA